MRFWQTFQKCFVVKRSRSPMKCKKKVIVLCEVLGAYALRAMAETWLSLIYNNLRKKSLNWGHVEKRGWRQSKWRSYEWQQSICMICLHFGISCIWKRGIWWLWWLIWLIQSISDVVCHQRTVQTSKDHRFMREIWTLLWKKLHELIFSSYHFHVRTVGKFHKCTSPALKNR